MSDLIAGQGGQNRFFVTKPEAKINAVEVHSGADVLRAPMQAMTQEIHVAIGDIVAKGQEIAVIEAMKMQHIILADAGGAVVQVFVQAGETISAGALFLAFTPDDTLEAISDTTGAPEPDHIRGDLAALGDRLARTLDETQWPASATATKPPPARSSAPCAKAVIFTNTGNLCWRGSAVSWGWRH